MNDVCDYDEPLRIKDICITVITVIMIISGSDNEKKVAHGVDLVIVFSPCIYKDCL
ncbi:MAG: hypothetical protein GY795_31780 [Desulfobacterales bacterium]|nr:hypothetical protein [Desulfobacterales bacterium]